MSLNRVQKLLFSEYCDFEDMVLIESPFAQTTREGKGIRQVHLGLTPSKLVLATDVLPPVEKSSVNYVPGIDPDIETFELIAIYPIECVNLSVFRRRKRQAIKAHFCNNRVFYFELGGFERRNMFWNLWCEKVKFLCPEYSGSSHSETSVATSSTNSTLYLVDSKQIVKPNGLKQLWCKFGTGKSDTSRPADNWTDRYLYLGKNLDESPLNYRPIMRHPEFDQFIKPKSSFKLASSRTLESIARDIHIGDSYHINRFGSGIREGCSTGLFLPAENYIVPRRFSQSSGQSSGLYINSKLSSNDIGDLSDMAENCVKLWERHDSSHFNSRHKRRYGFAPQPLFLHGLGPWNVTPGARFSIQIKRAVSAVNIRRQPIEQELRLPVAKRQLTATISCENLRHNPKKETKSSLTNFRNAPRKPVIFFWTPDYWYRPRSAKEAYNELQTHLNKLQNYRNSKIKKSRRRRFFRRRVSSTIKASSSESDSDSLRNRKKAKRKSAPRFSVFGSKAQEICDIDQGKESKETAMQYLKRILAVDIVLSAWDFDSTSLAQQLTMIDRDLFLKISALEMRVLIWQQSSKNAPNIAAIVAFAHRITCLVASDILKNECERARARLVSRFINVAYKCHKMGNFHSCRTVLFGLQSPAIYRLKCTWAYVRKKHASKYQMFEFLSRLYRDPRLPLYQKAFFMSKQNTPYLPFIGDVIAKLLDRIPDYKLGIRSHRDRGDNRPINKQGILKMTDVQTSMFAKILATIKLLNFDNIRTAASLKKPNERDNQLEINERTSRRGLCDYFKPLDRYEDNREKCLSETVVFLQQCQLSALHYCFCVNSLTMDYLLKARYKEERDNFYNSFRLESLHSSKWHLQEK